MIKPRLLLYNLLFAGLAFSCSVQDKDKQAAATETDESLQELVYEAATTSDTVIVTEHMVEKHFVRLPDTPQGYRAQALLEVIKAEDKEPIIPFVLEHYDPDFIDQVSQSDHTALLSYLQEQMQNTELTSVESLENVYRIGLKPVDSQLEYKLDISFEPQAPFKISGLRVL